MGLGRWSVVDSSVMWHGGGSGCGYSVVVGSGILGQSCTAAAWWEWVLGQSLHKDSFLVVVSMVVLWSLGFRFVVICLFDLGDFGMDFLL